MLNQLKKTLINKFMEERHKMTRQECEDYLERAFETLYECGKMDGVSELIKEDEK